MPSAVPPPRPERGPSRTGSVWSLMSPLLPQSGPGARNRLLVGKCMNVREGWVRACGPQSSTGMEQPPRTPGVNALPSPYPWREECSARWQLRPPRPLPSLPRAHTFLRVLLSLHLSTGRWPWLGCPPSVLQGTWQQALGPPAALGEPPISRLERRDTQNRAPCDGATEENKFSKAPS